MDDFLYALKYELMNKIPKDQVEHQLDLYRKYINDEMNQGKALEQVLRKLGDPTVVAGMILDAYDKKARELGDDEKKQKSIWDERTPEEINAMIQNPERGLQAKFDPEKGWDVRLGKLKLNTWYGTFIILGIVLVIFIVLSEILPGIKIG